MDFQDLEDMTSEEPTLEDISPERYGAPSDLPTDLPEYEDPQLDEEEDSLEDLEMMTELAPGEAVDVPEIPEQLREYNEFSGAVSPRIAEWLEPESLEDRYTNVGEALATTAMGAQEYLGYHSWEDLPGIRQMLGREDRSDHGALSKFFYAWTLPEQAVARQMVNVLENFDEVDAYTAKEMLSRDELHVSDLTNYYWGDPKDKWGTARRFIFGLATDIIFDPLSYVGIGALTQAGKRVMVGGKAIKGLDKASKLERQFFRSLPDIEKVIRADGLMDNIAPKFKQDVVDFNMRQLDEYSKGTLGFDELEKSLVGTGASKKKARDIYNKSLKKKAYLDEWIDGERGLTLGYHIPFTNFGAEMDLPFKGLQKSSAKVMKRLLEPVGGTLNMIRKSGLADDLYVAVKKLGTKTGFHNVDEAANKYLGGAELIKTRMAQWEDKVRTLLSPDGKPLSQLEIDDIIDELEYGVKHGTVGDTLAAHGKKPWKRGMSDYDSVLKKPTDEVLKNLEQFDPNILEEADKLRIEFLQGKLSQSRYRFSKSFQYVDTEGLDLYKYTKETDELLPGYYDDLNKIKDEYASIIGKYGPNRFKGDFSSISPTKDLLKLIVKSPDDIARQSRLAKHPERLEIIEEMREMNYNMVQEYKKRGIPFEELNPFGDGWVNSYVKHLVTNDWFKAMKETDSAADEAIEFVAGATSKVDDSALGRKYRGSIREANEASMKKHGVKIFVDDPIELHSRRMREMDQVARTYDLMEEAAEHIVYKRGSTKPAPGYYKIKPGDFDQYIAKVKGVIPGEDEIRKKYMQFIPDEFKRDDVWIPEVIMDRLIHHLNGPPQRGLMGHIYKGSDFFTRVWRNNALFGFGYIGLNAMSNATTYALAGTRHGMSSLKDAVHVIASKSGTKVFEFVDHAGVKRTMTSDELWQLAQEHNVLRSGFSSELRFDDIAEAVASNRQSRERLKPFSKTGIPWIKDKTAGDLADIVYLWRANRAVAQYMDDVPKLGIFIDRLKSGFSPAGAAEAAEKFYYNYNNVGRNARIVHQVLPFSTFPMKTAEMIAEQIKSGHLASLTVPGKVQAALGGAFVQDEPTRKFLSENSPHWEKNIDKIHGIIMPGGREVKLEMPWAKSTMTFFLDPKQNLHPILSMLGAWGSASQKSEDEFELESMTASDAKKASAEAFDMVIPAYLRESLALAEINGAIDFGGYFSDRYSYKTPTFDQGQTTYKGPSDQSPVANKFDNAADFGMFMEKKYGGNWLYRLFFPEEITDMANLTDHDVRTLSKRGEYIRQHFRQLSFGSARISSLDRTFFQRKFAIQRQVKKLENSMYQELQDGASLVRAEKITDKEWLETQQDQWPKAKEMLGLMYKNEALNEYYDWVLQVEKEYPDDNVLNLLFGTDEYKFDYRSGPDPRLSDRFSKDYIESEIVTESEVDLAVQEGISPGITNPAWLENEMQKIKDATPSEGDQYDGN